MEALQQWYDPADPVHGIEHVRRVVALAEKIAAAEGADTEIVRVAAYLHDAVDKGQALPNGRQTHHLAAAQIAAHFLRQAGWDEARIAAVQHCIRAHRFRQGEETPQTLEAKVVFDADKLDALGAIGAARAIARAVQKGLPFYFPPSPRFLESGVLESQELHSAYHEYWYKLRRLKERLFTPTARRLAAERETIMNAFFEALKKEAEATLDCHSPL
ncbi:MAG: HD domain-containing protein [Anaerolineales bacterium]|nr:HD domain-containing protein [Anaerolineales bacterium]MCS7248899.1 HD domain-containing protein [Anaerolineales bacterium]MDW8162712.1 HD domain-containing protein [Anaerolineales bacterium]MDW8446681.1 HD domain-containing protein [Anaerolineales bacterium]